MICEFYKAKQNIFLAFLSLNKKKHVKSSEATLNSLNNEKLFFIAFPSLSLDNFYDDC